MKRLVTVLLPSFIVWFMCLVTYAMVTDIKANAETKGNVKYEVTEDRVVVSCVDGKNPVLRTAPRPTGGYYAVVVCERRNSNGN